MAKGGRRAAPGPSRNTAVDTDRDFFVADVFAPIPNVNTPDVHVANENRKLNLTRIFELKRIRALAHGKFTVKMNLRGRLKLLNWLCSTPLGTASTECIVTMFNIDAQVVSPDAQIRRTSVLCMNNDDLRIIEALMTRVLNRNGQANWSLLTSRFTAESFADNLDIDCLSAS